MAVIELTKDNFNTETAQGKVLIDFWASWCGPCKMLSPIVDEIAEEAPDGLKVCKVNIDDCPELAQQFQVMSIPTLIVMESRSRPPLASARSRRSCRCLQKHNRKTKRGRFPLHVLREAAFSAGIKEDVPFVYTI